MRLGSIEFINSLPVDLGLLKGAVPFGGQIVSGAPAVLNEKILRGDLDISPVSVFWYAQHQSEFLLLPDLSISSESGVMSVLLFSRKPIGELAGHKISITPKGMTTPALLEILCRMRYGFKPLVETVQNGLNELGRAEALLLIGDEALEAQQRAAVKEGYFVTDLAEEWRAWTGLPLVFAVWAARRKYFESHPEEVLQAHGAILASKQWGLTHMEEVFADAELKTNLPKHILESYFSRLSYDLDDELKEGMRLYLDYAARCGSIQPVLEFEEVGDGLNKRQAVTL